MSSTRHAEASSSLRQEKFCSSAEYERGLLGNLVAQRCDALDDTRDHDLIYFLQLLSHHEGGLKKLATDVVDMFPERLCTKEMAEFGFAPKQIYSRRQVEAIRKGMKIGWFPLRGEEEEYCFSVEEAAKLPSSYPAADFINECRDAALPRGFEELLERLCLYPKEKVESLSQHLR